MVDVSQDGRLVDGTQVVEPAVARAIAGMPGEVSKDAMHPITPERAALTGLDVWKIMGSKEALSAMSERVTGWRPIETAPRDGTPVLVWYVGRPYVAEFTAILHPSRMRWAVRYPPEQGRTESNSVHDIHSLTWEDGRPVEGSHPGPTHWMPLPPPPSEG